MRWPLTGNNLNILCNNVNKNVLWIRYQWLSFVRVSGNSVLLIVTKFSESWFLLQLQLAGGGGGRFTLPAAVFTLSPTLMSYPSSSVLGDEAGGMWSLPPTSISGPPEWSDLMSLISLIRKAQLKKVVLLLKSLGSWLCRIYRLY
jgi:hypothetical protein